MARLFLRLLLLACFAYLCSACDYVTDVGPNEGPVGTEIRIWTTEGGLADHCYVYFHNQASGTVARVDGDRCGNSDGLFTITADLPDLDPTVATDYLITLDENADDREDEIFTVTPAVIDCVIDGFHYPDGDRNPDNPCEVCDIENPNEWTPVCEWCGLLAPACEDQDHDTVCVGESVLCGPPDCNDGNPAVYPGAAEIECDGVDYDCDGQTAIDQDCHQPMGFGANVFSEGLPVETCVVTRTDDPIDPYTRAPIDPPLEGTLRYCLGSRQDLGSTDDDDTWTEPPNPVWITFSHDPAEPMVITINFPLLALKQDDLNPAAERRSYFVDGRRADVTIGGRKIIITNAQNVIFANIKFADGITEAERPWFDYCRNPLMYGGFVQVDCCDPSACSYEPPSEQNCETTIDCADVTECQGQFCVCMEGVCVNKTLACDEDSDCNSLLSDDVYTLRQAECNFDPISPRCEFKEDNDALNFWSGEVLFSEPPGSTNVWIDHCSFDSFPDELLDLDPATEYVTLSWNRFENAEKAILNGGETTNPYGWRSHVTMYNNYFHNVGSRNPMVRWGDWHIFNNFLDGWAYWVDGVFDFSNYGMSSSSTAQLITSFNILDATEDARNSHKAIQVQSEEAGSGYWQGTCDYFLNEAIADSSPLPPVWFTPADASPITWECPDLTNTCDAHCEALKAYVKNNAGWQAP